MTKLRASSFGKLNAVDMFYRLIHPKFLALNESTDLINYCDFVLSIGILKDWIKQEPRYNLSNCEEKDWFYITDENKIFNTIYNNMKHVSLKAIPTISYYSSAEMQVTGTLNQDNMLCWDDNLVWNDDEFWIEDHIIGELGNLKIVCRVSNQSNSLETQYYSLFHICQSIYDFFKNLIDTTAQE